MLIFFLNCNFTCYFCQVRKITISFLLLLFLISSTEFHQFLKLPLLFNHFMEHQQKENQSFIDFLVMHYGQKSVKDEDYKKDEQLPSKLQMGANLLSIHLFVDHTSFSLTKPFTENKKVNFISQSFNFISFSLLANIWQPPKL